MLSNIVLFTVLLEGFFDYYDIETLGPKWFSNNCLPAGRLNHMKGVLNCIKQFSVENLTLVIDIDKLSLISNKSHFGGHLSI